MDISEIFISFASNFHERESIQQTRYLFAFSPTSLVHPIHVLDTPSRKPSQVLS